MKCFPRQNPALPPASLPHIFPVRLSSQTNHRYKTNLSASLSNCTPTTLPLQPSNNNPTYPSPSPPPPPPNNQPPATSHASHNPLSTTTATWIPQPKTTPKTTTGPGSLSKPPRPPGKSKKSTRRIHSRPSNSTRQPPSRRSGMPWAQRGRACFRAVCRPRRRWCWCSGRGRGRRRGDCLVPLGNRTGWGGECGVGTLWHTWIGI